jgi:hypothetical protein
VPTNELASITPEQLKAARDHDAEMGALAFRQLEREGIPLNDHDSVDRMVRAYLSTVMDLRRDWAAAGGSGGDETVRRIARMAHEANDIFLGSDHRYRLLPWNSPDQLGSYLKRRFEMQSEPDETVAALLLRLAHHTIDLVDREAKGEFPTFFVQSQVDGAIRAAVKALLGMESSSEELRGEVDPMLKAVVFLLEARD